MNDQWVEVEKRLPKVGEVVEVRGIYTAIDMQLPRARLLKDGDRRRVFCGQWESCEWRGSVGITHWRKLSKRAEQ